MVREARAILKLKANPGYREALQHLTEFSHVWIVFVFHQSIEKGWRPTIRPPRVDAPRKVGVFASRSPHRPNPIGMSAVRLESINLDAPDGIEIFLSGVDLLDQTPVLDIKPYLPFADRIDDATSGWAGSEIPRYQVTFAAAVEEVLAQPFLEHPNLRRLLSEILAWDPRPTSQRRAMPIEAKDSEGLKFGFRIYNYDVQWQIQEARIHVIELKPALISSIHPNWNGEESSWEPTTP